MAKAMRTRSRPPTPLRASLDLRNRPRQLLCCHHGIRYHARRQSRRPLCWPSRGWTCPRPRVRSRSALATREAHLVSGPVRSWHFQALWARSASAGSPSTGRRPLRAPLEMGSPPAGRRCGSSFRTAAPPRGRQERRCGSSPGMASASAGSTSANFQPVAPRKSSWTSPLHRSRLEAAPAPGLAGCWKMPMDDLSGLFCTSRPSGHRSVPTWTCATTRRSEAERAGLAGIALSVFSL
mmetsp:Transcript_32788/g.91273  ORF Transcript_32788/g.91273 Transcript_32788/m.91273 type:complete len:237 (-) Transcript_32788:43-753(-)